MQQAIVQNFFPDKKIESVNLYGNGHINDTYKVLFENEPDAYILQRINTKVFLNPKEIISTHIKLQNLLAQTSNDLEIPQLFPTQSGEFLFIDIQGGAWRLINYITDTQSIDLVEHDWQAYEAGKGYGWFAKICASLKPDDFEEAISNFHNLSFRLYQLSEAIKNDKAGRLSSIPDVIQFFKERENQLRLIEQMVDEGEIPLHIVHNDTKINNILFKNNIAHAVIDLDTVGPGILFFDYGDAIRTSANTAVEDEQDISKVLLNIAAFKAFTDGYMAQVKPIITQKESENFYMAPVLMTYIIGSRFLTDYLNGDIYYKTKYNHHNLVRCKVQMALIESMEQNQTAMKRIIHQALNT